VLHSCSAVQCMSDLLFRNFMNMSVGASTI